MTTTPASASRTMRRQALASGTALAALVAAGVLSPLSVGSALADCVVTTGGSPDTIVCSDVDTDGVNLVSTDGTGVDVRLENGAVLTGGAGTSLGVTLNGGIGTPTRTFNFDMDAGTTIVGSGTQVNVEGGIQTFLGVPVGATAVNGTWNINGTINSTQSDAVVISLPRGTGSAGIEMNVGANGQVMAAGNAITVDHDGLGQLNYTLNNSGRILAGGDGVNVYTGPLATGNGSIIINNDGVIGDAANSVGGSAINITSASILSTNIQVTNGPGDNLLPGAGTIHSTGTAIDIFQANGTSSVTNAEGGSITSTAGHGINIEQVLGSANVTNEEGAEITAGGGAGINVITGGASNIVNDGSIVASGTGINVGSLGSSSVTGSGSIEATDGAGILVITGVPIIGSAGSTVDVRDGSVTSKNGPGIVAAVLGTGDVEINSGEVNAGAGGLALPAPLDGIGLPIGGGVIALSNQGNATVNTHGDITVADSGIFGAAALSIEGAATVNLNGVAVDGSLIGATAIVLGGDEDANITTGEANVNASLAGLLGLNLGSGDVNIDAEGAVIGDTTQPLVGIAGLAIGGGDVDIEAQGSTVNAGAGILGLSDGGNVWIDSGEVNATGAGPLGIGVAGIAIGGGDVDIDAHGDVTANGLFGILGTAEGGGDVAIDLDEVTVTAQNGVGIAGLAIGGGDVDIEAQGSTVNAGAGILGLSDGGNVWIDSGEVNATAGGPLGIGVAGIAIGGGDVDIDAHGDVTANGLFGILGTAEGGGDVAIGLDEVTVTAQNGVGIAGLAIGGGDVDIDAEGSTVNAGAGILGLAEGGGNVRIDAGQVIATGAGPLGIGVAGIATDGAVDIHLHDDVQADGLFAVGAVASGDVTIDLAGRADITNQGGLGIAAVGGGSVAIDGRFADIDSADTGILAIGSNVAIDIDNIRSANGSGILATAFDGDVDIGLNGDIEANGLAGIGAAASGDVTILTSRVDITNQGGLGIAVVGGGSVVIDGRFADIDSADTGILAIGSDVAIDIDSIRSASGSGILATAFDGNVDIGLGGDIEANGLAGIGAVASADVTIDLLGNSLSNLGGAGVATVAGGNSTVNATGSSIRSGETGILAIGESVDVASGEVTSTDGSGVVAVALGGDANLFTHDKISADNGLFGASAISFGGNAQVVVGADIDPPAIGASAIALGSGNATLEVLGGVLVEADLIGLGAISVGDGDVSVKVGSTANIQGGSVGIATANIGGNGGTEIDIGSQASVIGGSSAIALAHFSDGEARITNQGLIQGDGGTSPVITALTGNGVTIDNRAGGVIRGDLGAQEGPAGAFEPLILSVGDGATVINNQGELHGTMTLVDLSGEGNRVSNEGFWRTGGLNTIVSGSGNDVIDNTGTVQANGQTVFVVDRFENRGGRLTTVNNSVSEVTTVTGDFLANGDSRLAFDATLRPGGDADVLVVVGNVDGSTSLAVNDLAHGPGAYTGNEDAVLFALVGGNTNASNFTTHGGLDRGLFRYDAYLRSVPVNDLGYQEWVLASTLDREAFELPVVTYGAQNLWHMSTGAWLDRSADLRAARAGPQSAPLGFAPGVAIDTATGGVHANAKGPGAWGRVFGGQTRRDMSNTVSAPAGLVGPAPTYDDRLYQDYLGFMAGLDLGYGTTANGGLWTVGVMAGYASSNLDFRTSTTGIHYSQGSVGAYATYIDGGFFIDGVVKADFGSVGHSMSGGGAFADRFDARYTSIGAMVDTGYRFDLASRWFIEPKASLAWVNTSVGDRALLGTDIGFDHGTSLRGRLGARVGASIDNGTSLFEPYLEASLWNEFSGNYRARLGSNGFTLPVTYDTGGAFGEVTAGATFIDLGSKWSAFGSGSVQFGKSGFQTVSGNLGFRKTW